MLCITFVIVPSIEWHVIDSIRYNFYSVGSVTFSSGCTYVGITCTQLLSLGRVNDRKHKQKIQDSSTVMLIIHKFTFLLKYKRAGRKSSSSPVVIN